jgi:two-component system response regulator AtoC
MPIELTPIHPSELLNGPDIVWGKSAAVGYLNRMVTDLACTNIPFLLVGESGTGKEVYAKAIHRLSGGDATQLRKISCLGIDPHGLLGEIQKKSGWEKEPGKVNTVFLDEIEELPQECQKLLLALAPNGELQTGEGTIRARIMCATTRDMEKEVAEGRFRSELYFRLSGACLRLPPLRERLEDIPAFTDHFLRRHAELLKKKAPEMNRETMELLLSYHWPGNIRELENMARKMVALGETSLAVADLRVARMTPPPGATPARVSSLKVAAKAASRQTERELILKALERTKWNRKRAARELEISYKSLLYKLKQIEALGKKS